MYRILIPARPGYAVNVVSIDSSGIHYELIKVGGGDDGKVMVQGRIREQDVAELVNGIGNFPILKVEQ